MMEENFVPQIALELILPNRTGEKLALLTKWTLNLKEL